MCLCWSVWPVDTTTSKGKQETERETLWERKKEGVQIRKLGLSELGGWVLRFRTSLPDFLLYPKYINPQTRTRTRCLLVQTRYPRLSLNFRGFFSFVGTAFSLSLSLSLSTKQSSVGTQAQQPIESHQHGRFYSSPTRPDFPATATAKKGPSPSLDPQARLCSQEGSQDSFSVLSLRPRWDTFHRFYKPFSRFSILTRLRLIPSFPLHHFFFIFDFVCFINLTRGLLLSFSSYWKQKQKTKDF